VIRPLGIIGHYECRSLNETVPVFTDLLALEVVEKGRKHVIVKHPNTDWHLIVHEAGPEAGDKPVMNHYGVRVSNSDEVDIAWRYISEHKEEYRLGKITKPRQTHLAYSLYFKEPGGNYWEIECYLPEAFKMASVYAPHWKAPWEENRFSGKGYVPQGLTHGTLECNDKAVTERFLRDVLGLHIVPGERPVIYFKHPDTPWYVVAVPVRNRRYLNSNSRFTLVLESPDSVAEAHRTFAQPGKEMGITELGKLKENGSFFLTDPDRNWWEITAKGVS
jgi:catechol 2,3-dioxygenase-like lactoylglutathione lyase family enzyme